MTSPRPLFDPVDTNFDPIANVRKDDVESPSLSSSNALARFEFEPGRSKDGTKVLMVEWEDDDATRVISGDWEVSWDGKKTVLPAKDQPKALNGEGPVNRLYFMLGPGISVPTSVKLKKGNVEWRTNPLPAIFAPELGATAREAGRKGVLHTIWAKKRLQVLQAEIDAESRKNTEGVALEMAVAEKAWIEHNFGVTARPAKMTVSTAAQGFGQGHLNSPSSPRSPGGGGRLMDKLKGLKIGTTSEELANAPGGDAHNPLSPETSDVAVGSVGSFAALKGSREPSSTQRQQQQQQQQQKVTAVRPPESLLAEQQQQQGGRMASLNAFAATGTGFSAPPAEPADDDGANDLFALPISPRSPEMAKSPFSFAMQDTRKYVKG
ncbi:hypothetical protein EJ03DRAFT_329188 [Teratosphaeria nubilosa]|uniref:Uncharacterized protein n=1 Tax=Teratosphaeria nubilosa TaxID=161662 RepID=A0A6G1L3A9_9PEZI|nr:hypothetical protein EJ03DRAFT_329188 [Teratosphaeria nubilosa]